MVFHLAEHPKTHIHSDTEIAEQTMERAITLAMYYADHAMSAFGAMRQHPSIADARLVLERILDRSEPTAPVTCRELHIRMQRRFPKSADLTGPLSVLEDHGYIRRQETPCGPGRPTERFDVHPDAVTK